MAGVARAEQVPGLRSTPACSPSPPSRRRPSPSLSGSGLAGPPHRPRRRGTPRPGPAGHPLWGGDCYCPALPPVAALAPEARRALQDAYADALRRHQQWAVEQWLARRGSWPPEGAGPPATSPDHS